MELDKHSFVTSSRQTHLSQATVVLGLGWTVLASAFTLARTSPVGFGLAP